MILLFASLFFTACEKENLDQTLTEELTEVIPEVVFEDLCDDVDVESSGLMVNLETSNDSVQSWVFSALDSVFYDEYFFEDSTLFAGFGVIQGTDLIEFTACITESLAVGTHPFKGRVTFANLADSTATVYKEDDMDLNIIISERTDGVVSGQIYGILINESGAEETVCVVFKDLPIRLVDMAEDRCVGPNRLEFNASTRYTYSYWCRFSGINTTISRTDSIAIWTVQYGSSNVRDYLKIEFEGPMDKEIGTYNHIFKLAYVGRGDSLVSFQNELDENLQMIFTEITENTYSANLTGVVTDENGEEINLYIELEAIEY